MFVKLLLAASITAASFVAQTATASTVNFDGLSNGTNVNLGSDLVADELRIVNGNCAANDCMALNMGEETIVTSSAVPAIFTVEAFWFQLLGKKSELTITSNKGFLVFDTDTHGHNNGGQSFSLAGLAAFQNITSLKFDDTSSNAGNIRVDDLVLSAVPLPASSLLLVAGIGGLAAMRRRKG